MSNESVFVYTGGHFADGITVANHGLLDSTGERNDRPYALYIVGEHTQIRLNHEVAEQVALALIVALAENGALTMDSADRIQNIVFGVLREG